MELIKLLLTLEVNPETGETKCINKEIINNVIKKSSTKKSVKKDENPNPQITLEDNKYILNSAAVELMGVKPEDRLDIKYEKKRHQMIPVIGISEAFGTKNGNKITKNFTVSCRGKANEQLSSYGNIFEIFPHTTKTGLFILKGNIEPEEYIPDENVEILEKDLELNSKIDDLLTNTDAEVKEISAFDFNL